MSALFCLIRRTRCNRFKRVVEKGVGGRDIGKIKVNMLRPLSIVSLGLPKMDREYELFN